MKNPGRNDPCPCGSGKKFKRCCGITKTKSRANQSGMARERSAADVIRMNIGHDTSRQKPTRLEDAQRNFHLGNAFKAQGRMDQAIAHYERALSLDPDNTKVLNNLGLALASQDKTDQAIAHYGRALSLDPNDALAHNNLGNAFKVQGQMDLAIAHYERALSLMPDHAMTHHNLGSALALQGQMAQAIAHYERAWVLRPDNIATHQSLLLTLNYLSDKDPRAVFAAHRDFARRWETPLGAFIQPHTNDCSPQRRLRVGYVSSDFRQHSVGYFVEPVLAHHEHERFEIFCYSNHFQDDAVTARLKSYADHWRRLDGLSDEQAAQRIRADKIDILLDLNGHTGRGRLLVFARKPAPIQVTWLGYPNTTGLSSMDYRLTDGFADPVGSMEHLHSEKLVRLPECFACYQPPADAPETSALPARESGFVTFGSFNNLAKITGEVMALWGAILRFSPRARLCLKSPALGGTDIQRRIRKDFAELGVDSQRLELRGYDLSTRAHLESYGSIDIGLDPFPYNGATTTCEAMWMGVPVVTLAGKTHAGRVGVSQLSNLGLTELIADTRQDYMAIAVGLAGDIDRLGALREQLRPRMTASPLTDGRRFTRNLEQTYRMMWQDWCCKASGSQNVPG